VAACAGPWPASDIERAGLGDIDRDGIDGWLSKYRVAAAAAQSAQVQGMRLRAPG